jgi:tetratricopeptide (TPR) repeat protein
MKRWLWLGVLLPLSFLTWASVSSGQAAGSSRQNNSSDNSSQNAPPAAGQANPNAAKTPSRDLSPPRSDRVNADDLEPGVGESSSKDTQIDFSAPEDDAKAHPKSAEAVSNAEASTGGASGVGEFHPWDPHKAAKSVEVGDFYFKRKNYRAAEDRYREALYYKDDDAIATYRLAECLEKLERPNDALTEYESYLKILPYGPQAGESKKAIERLKAPAVSAKQDK